MTISEILKKFDKEISIWMINYYASQTGGYFQKDLKEKLKSFIRSSICEILDEIVPEKETLLDGNECLWCNKFEDSHYHNGNCFCGGFDEARKQIQEKIKKVKK